MLFGSSFALWGAPWLFLLSSGVLPGRSSEAPLDFWGALGVGLGALGGSQGLVDHPWRILGDSSGTPWVFLGALGTLLGHSCGSWGTPSGILGGSRWLPGGSFGVLGCLGGT